jgi:threonine/homoserine/homoserine lactone efflux protein
MDVLQILIAWFLLSLTGALAPGPLSAAVVMQASRHGKLHGMLPMLGHAVVELGIVATIILSVQSLALTDFAIDIMVGFGGFIVILFGLLALRDYRYSKPQDPEMNGGNTSAATIIEATAQGATVSIFSPYFLLWWFAIGLANVTLLISELQVGLGTVFIAAVLIYLTHISTDFLFGAFLTVGSSEASKRAVAGGINWINVVIGVFQVALGIWFIITAIL